MFRKTFIFFVGVCAMSIAVLGKPVQAAEQYSIKEMTPEVMSALESRRGRYDALQQLKQQGKVGENNRGYVEAFSGEADVQGIVASENADRKIIYQTIAAQNNLKDAIGTIEKVFAQTQREKAGPGEKIQSADGSWVTK